MPKSSQTSSAWPEAIATVLECHYDMRAGRALAFGAPSSKHFRIRYNYYANGETHEAELFSATAMPQNTLFPIRYNPAEADHHTTTDNPLQSPRNPVLAIAIAGSLLLSLAWLFLLHSCS